MCVVKRISIEWLMIWWRDSEVISCNSGRTVRKRAANTFIQLRTIHLQLVSIRQMILKDMTRGHHSRSTRFEDHRLRTHGEVNAVGSWQIEVNEGIAHGPPFR